MTVTTRTWWGCKRGGEWRRATDTRSNAPDDRRAVESTAPGRKERTVPSLESDMRVSAGCWFSPWTDLLSGFRKGHSNEGRAQCLGVHLHSGSTQVVILPSLHIGRLVPINQPFLNHTRSYACTDCARFVHSEVLVRPATYFRTWRDVTWISTCTRVRVARSVRASV